MLLFLQSFLHAQVSTLPQSKNFLIEKGTGHVCGSCPTITQRCDSVIDSHPGRGMLIEYHFGPDAVPQAPPLDLDFTTPYGDTIYDPAGLNWPFYLNMMVNRRDQGPPYGSTFCFFTGYNQIQEEADTLVNQSSPVNLYLSSSFNAATRLLTVNVQLYYTATSATGLNFIQVVLTEDSIIAMQLEPSGAWNPDFNHMNTFRTNLNGFNGDTVFTTTMGTLVSRTYTYTIPAAYKNISCNSENCNLTLYVAEDKAASGVQSFTGKIMNVIRAHVGSNSVTDVAAVNHQQNIRIFPNPTKGMITVNSIDEGSYSIVVVDAIGKTVYSEKAINSLNTKIDLSQFSEGLYLIRIISPESTEIHKIYRIN
jgi:hypothetical protein